MLVPIAGRANSAAVDERLDVLGTDDALNPVSYRQQANQATQYRKAKKIIESASTAHAAP